MSPLKTNMSELTTRCYKFHSFFTNKNTNKDENVHRFALSTIRGKLLEREREKRERDQHNLEREASMDHPKGEGFG